MLPTTRVAAALLVCLLLCGAGRPRAAAAPKSPKMITASIAGDRLEIVYRASEIERPGRAVFVALDTDVTTGSAVVPFAKNGEGSTVFLPFRADRICWMLMTADGPAKRLRLWKQTMWSPALDVKREFEVTTAAGEVRFSVALAGLPKTDALAVAVYAKDMSDQEGWGRVLANAEFGVNEGVGDRTVSRFAKVPRDGSAAVFRTRLGPERVRIYQLFPRLFGNTNETRRRGGTLAENGCGKFADINEAALGAIREMGFTHVWLTGVLEQATATDYSAIGAPADDPDLLKGVAGSPYAIKDCFDVSPDYARDPAQRLGEFGELLGRLHAAGLKAIIDFVPNHVARSYRSDVQPDLSFGARDDRRHFFSPRNNFFHLRREDAGHGPPLVLPTAGLPGCDGDASPASSSTAA